MVASAVYVLDLKGKIIISRDYRGDVPKSAIEKCVFGVVCRCDIGREGRRRRRWAGAESGKRAPCGVLRAVPMTFFAAVTSTAVFGTTH